MPLDPGASHVFLQYRPAARVFSGQNFPFVSFFFVCTGTLFFVAGVCQPDEEEGPKAEGAGQGEGSGTKALTGSTATKTGNASSPSRSRSPRSRSGGGSGPEVGEVLHKGPMLGELPALGRPPGVL